MLSSHSLDLKIIRSYWQSPDKNWLYPSYQRPYNWLIHTLSGHGIVKMKNHSIELLPNTLALLPLNQQCHYQCIQPMKIGAFAFTLELSSGADVFQLYHPPKHPVSCSNTLPISNIIEWQNKRTETNAQYFQALTAAYQLLTPIIDKSVVSKGIETYYFKLEKIFSYIDQHLTQNIKIPQLAAVHGTSTAHFSRWFSSIVETSPKQYINQKRIDLACKKLLLTDNRIDSIAYQCGYEDPLYFSKSFKRITSLTPRDYRKTKRYDLL
jgi:AraC-like DNA-binding protein